MKTSEFIQGAWCLQLFLVEKSFVYPGHYEAAFLALLRDCLPAAVGEGGCLPSLLGLQRRQLLG